MRFQSYSRDGDILTEINEAETGFAAKRGTQGKNKLIEAVFYVWRFYLERSLRLIPHPRMRAGILRLLGAHVGRYVRIEDIVIRGNECGLCLKNLTIGDYSIITQTSRLDLSDEILIGKKCTIGGLIYTHQDPGTLIFDSPTVRRYPRKVAPVIIEDNAWIGVGAIVLCGVRIGENAVIGAGSIVNKDIPADTMASGVPARVIKRFSKM